LCSVCTRVDAQSPEAIGQRTPIRLIVGGDAGFFIDKVECGVDCGGSAVGGAWALGIGARIGSRYTLSAELDHAYEPPAFEYAGNRSSMKMLIAAVAPDPRRPLQLHGGVGVGKLELVPSGGRPITSLDDHMTLLRVGVTFDVRRTPLGWGPFTHVTWKANGGGVRYRLIVLGLSLRYMPS
jgi:hypothetical protein